MSLSTLYLIKKAIRDDWKIKDESKRSKETQCQLYHSSICHQHFGTYSGIYLCKPYIKHVAYKVYVETV